jgi:hypothetical protein
MARRKWQLISFKTYFWFGDLLMAKPQLGAKVVCKDCGARFYDLKRSDAECPKCSTIYKAAKVSKQRKIKRPETKIVKAHIVLVDDTDDSDDEALLLDDVDVDGDGDVDDDNDDNDDDDLSEVIVHVNGSEEDRI